MKLSVSYNVFDGEELLEKSISTIRSYADHVSVVWQKTSNFGNPCHSRLENLLKDLASKRLINQTLEFIPDCANPAYVNEVAKRNIGLEIARETGCTHQMSMDTDEFYVGEQFENLKNIVNANGHDASYCEMLTYFKKPTYQVRPFNAYHVPLIYEVKPSAHYVAGHPSPVVVDPTRRMSLVENPLILTRDEMEMHHMSYVRRDIKSKIINSTSKSAFTDVSAFFEMFDEYKLGETFFTTHPPGSETTVEVDNIFGLSEL